MVSHFIFFLEFVSFHFFSFEFRAKISEILMHAMQCNAMYSSNLPKLAMNAKCFVLKEHINRCQGFLYVHTPNNGGTSREANLISHKFTLCVCNQRCGFDAFKHEILQNS